MSPQRAAANAANAQHSTGPRTPEGKAASSRNAVKHGLASRDLVVRDDEQDAFHQLQQSLLQEIAPAGALEQFAFNPSTASIATTPRPNDPTIAT